MVRVTPITNGIYHVYNRGVEKRNVFLDSADYLRFIRSLEEFNTTESGVKIGRDRISKKLEKIVDILAFCLMPNHFHLMLQQKTDSGVSDFMQKVGIGYTMYFNKRRERSGVLFQGKYKLVHITDGNHLQHLPYYIHLNPLDMILPEWRDGTIHDTLKALRFLETYRWSSYPDYIGLKNFPSVTQREFLTETLGKPEEQKTYMIDWIKRDGLETIEHLILESPES